MAESKKTPQGVGYRKGNAVTVKPWKNHPNYKYRVAWVEGGRHRNKGFDRKKAAESWATCTPKEAAAFWEIRPKEAGNVIDIAG